MTRMPAGPRLLCIYQHAPTPGAPGIYRHRVYFGELVRRGWHVDLVSTPINYMTGRVPPAYRHKLHLHEQIDGIDHHWVWASGSIHASKLRRVANYISFTAAAFARAVTLPRPDAILVSSPPLTVGTLGPLLARRFRAPWLLEVRDVWPESAVSVGWLTRESPGYRILERIAHHLASSAEAVLVPTPGLVDDLRRHGAHEVEVVPGTVIDAAASDDERRAARAALGVGDTQCVFLYAGAVGVANGLDLLVDAVHELPRDVDAVVIVAGDGSARNALEHRISEESVDRIRLLGAVPKGRVQELLAASDVCLHLLRPDPVFASAQPTKMLEYFSAHRPVITTVAGLPAELAIGAAGSFAPTSFALAAELRRWAELGTEERRAKGEEAFAFGNARFGLEQSVDRLEGLLRTVTARAPAAGGS